MVYFDPDECSEEEFLEYELNRDSDGLYDAINKWRDTSRDFHFADERAYIAAHRHNSRREEKSYDFNASDCEIPF